MAPPSKSRFFEAAFNGNLRLLKQLAKEFDNGQGLAKTYASVRDEKDQTVLHFAASGGKCDICNYLVKNIKLDVNIRDKNGYAVLHHAVLSGHLSTVRYLVQVKADISLCSGDGCTPLHLAADKGHVEIMEYLISKGAIIECMAETAGTPLHMAAASGKQDAVLVLLSHKANPNIAIHHFFTPLLMSIAMAESFECLEQLLKGGADPNIGACDVDPLGHAADLGNGKMVECLLKYGANPNPVDSSGFTPLERCAVNWNHEMMRILFPVTAWIESYPDWSIFGIEKHIHSPEVKEQVTPKRYRIGTSTVIIYFSCTNTISFEVIHGPDMEKRTVKLLRKQREIQEKLLLWKEKGKEAFQNNDYLNAIHWYSKAITMIPDATLFSNRSLCSSRLYKGDDALSDAVACIHLKPDWSKGHYRKGVALKLLKRYRDAAEAFAEALMLDPKNKESKKELEEVLRMTGKYSDLVIDMVLQDVHSVKML